MRSHNRLNNKKSIDVLSLVDLKQIAWLSGRNIEEGDHTFNNEKVYHITDIVGLFTFNELKNLLLH